MSGHSIVEYIGESSKEKCGYCKQTGGYNSHGFWAHTMSCDDYQGLINRNWRRSGQYCYLPNNKNTCCPMYTIKCDAINFKLSRSHKKVLKKMKKFLHDGTKEKNFIRSHAEASTSNDPKPSKEHSKIELTGIETKDLPKEEVSVKGDKSPEEKVTLNVSSVNEQKRAMNPRKKKVIRLERKKAKLAAKGLTLADVKPRHVNVQKSLEDYLNEEPKNGKHKLKVKLVESKEGSSASFLNLFKMYQTKVHNDPPEQNSQKTYERFLVNTPLQFIKNETTPECGLGSFHYQYFLDDELIAVGVIDILPECVSSVYFYYNPDYSFLSLGTYASLREIALVRELSKQCPGLSNYYLGFYIPTCPKMRYKANVKPSYLLCPEVFTWHLLDENLNNEIDAVRYRRINNSQNDEDAVARDDIKYVAVLFNRTAMKYRDYKRTSRKKSSHDDADEVFEYASKVGKKLSNNMLLFRS